MKPSISVAIASLVLAGAAQAASMALEPTWRTEKDFTFLDQPVASPLRADGPDSPLLNDIAKAINDDASLKNAKITVQAENGVVLLTGVAQDAAQMKRASEIAAEKAGEGNVINVMRPSRTTFEKPQQDLAAGTRQNAAS